jgi:hypothetical protein
MTTSPSRLIMKKMFICVLTTLLSCISYRNTKWSLHSIVSQFDNRPLDTTKPILTYWHTLKLFDRFNCESKGENSRRIKSWGTLLDLQHFGSRRACWSSGMGTRTSDKRMNYSHGLTQTKQQAVLCIVGALLVHGRPKANIDSRDSSQPRLEGSHHLPLYSILCAWPWN